MYAYLLSYIILFVLTLKEITIKKYSQNQMSILIILFIFIFTYWAGIRYGIGTDYYNYLNIFQGINSFSDYNYLEPGFRFIVTIVKKLGFSEFSLFFVFAFILLCFMLVGIKKNSKYPVFSIFIFMTVFYIGYVFNGLRQGIAMSLLVFVLKDIELKNFKKVFVYTILGMTIHYSAVFIIIGYFFNKIIIKKMHYILMTIIFMFIVVINDFWSDIIIHLMPEYIALKINLYSYNYESEIDLLGIMQRLMIIFPFILYFNFLKRDNDSFEVIFKLYYLGFIFYSIFSFQEVFATRINMYFRILEIILFPYLLTLRINRFEKLFLFLFIIIWATTLYITDLSQPLNYPFRTLFER